MNATSETPAAAATAPQDNQFVTFSVAGETFAVPMAPVQEIIRVPEVARLPLAPPSLDGLANLRGRVLPIVNLRRIFAVGEHEHDDATRALVINLGHPLGFVVDRVASVVNVDAGEIEPAASIQSVVRSEYLTGVIRRQASPGQAAPPLMMIVDFERLVREEFASISAGAARTSGAAAGVASRDGPAAQAGAATSDELRLVSFTVCDQEYALDIADVQEIVQMPEQVTTVPNTPAHVIGLISLRQRLLPLVSLRGLFGLPPAAADIQHRIVVAALPDGSQVGLVTDAVKEVLSVPRHQADAMPGVLSRDRSLQEFESICRLDDGRRLVSIIATDKLLGLQEIREAISAARAQSAGQSGEEQAMATTGSTTTGDDEDTQVVIFRLGAEEFGVPIMSVQEIVRVPESLTRVPKTPAFVEGVINLRGTVLPVIDQRKRLGLPSIERNDGQRIMVYHFGGLRTGFIVDSVAEVLRIPRALIEPAPELSEEQRLLITRVAKVDDGRRLVMLIEAQQLLGAQEVSAMGDGMSEGEVEPPAAPSLARAA